MAASQTVQLDEEKDFRLPSHRHAAPSAPWPWVDIGDNVDPIQLASPLPPVPEPCAHKECGGCWRGYPQSLYPNWTPSQVKKSSITKAISQYRRDTPCIIHQVDVNDGGLFHVPDPGRIASNDENVDETWEHIINIQVPDDNRVRIMFIENLSGPMLQILGTRYNIEPFFFSSSLNWIPSRYVEGASPGEGDHITIALTFVHSVLNSNDFLDTSATTPSGLADEEVCKSVANHMIDTHAPLSLHSNERLIIQDLLSVHLIRRKRDSVIISYHPDSGLPTTKAAFLHERIRFAGQSVYWQSIFQKSPDPTFVLLLFIWHTLYAWDEALEHIYAHICTLETEVVNTSQMSLTQELHIIRAHHLHYTSMLEDIRKSIVFIQETPNPALDTLPDEERKFNQRLLQRECTNLLREVQRLEADRSIHNLRLKNVMNLVFSSVNIEDSRRMQKMTEAASQDSAAMKQIAYLSMVFLPASFVAAVFGMNVDEITPGTNGTLSHYVEAALPFTIVTIWIIIAAQNRYIFPPHLNFWMRLTWPVVFIWQAVIHSLDKWKRKFKLGRKETMSDYISTTTVIINDSGVKKD